MTPIANLFEALPAAGGAEQFLELLALPGLRIERIVSTGQASPPGFWYDQADGEWVLVLCGEALLRFEDEPESRRLKAGDFMAIAPRRRHRVEWTNPGRPTIWLAVHHACSPNLSKPARIGENSELYAAASGGAKPAQGSPMSHTEQQHPVQHDENHIIAERREKLAQWRRTGRAFPNDFQRENTAAKLLEAYGEKTAGELESLPVEVKVAGRMMLKRVMGKASFATLQDLSGRIQVYVTKDKVGEEVYGDFKHWDLGDILGVVGTLMKTRTGELTIQASEIRLLTKSLRPLPDKFHGLHDVELKYRQRYVDLIMNEETRFTFQARSRIVSSIRHYMDGHGFMEVETPMMHPIPGGAAAKPFITHHNALDMQQYLRIAPELYLKRLVIGGFEKVYEINRNFRNEGLSPRHNPEFTMMEFYEAYADYKSLMNFTEGLLRHAAREALGTETFVYQGRELDLSRPFDRLTMVEAVKKYCPQYTDEQLNDAGWLREQLEAMKVEIKGDMGLGALQLLFFEETAEAQLWNPTFIVDYPVEVSPLARASDTNPEITERFELFIVGREIANGFSELNDPEDQAARFHAQAAAKEAGDEEAMYYDADYIRALEYGLPPTGGCGIGIDRLVMLLTDAPSIRDVILFPQMRPE